uniref:(northern house mosquito) hypothetical protein n=1 Tax=Culex pipiens TaxID=7175 RepID=A0A8D8JHD9_CULPI
MTSLEKTISTSRRFGMCWKIRSQSRSWNSSLARRINSRSRCGLSTAKNGSHMVVFKSTSSETILSQPSRSISGSSQYSASSFAIESSTIPADSSLGTINRNAVLTRSRPKYICK